MRSQEKDRVSRQPDTAEIKLEDLAEELIEESKRLNTTPRETVRKAIEFGFQKGIKAKINTTTISDCPIKDEWHKVADGDLPKVETWVIGFYYGKDNWHKIFYRSDGKWWGEGQLCQPPYAWKEIVLPKE